MKKLVFVFCFLAGNSYAQTSNEWQQVLNEHKGAIFGCGNLLDTSLPFDQAVDRCATTLPKCKAMLPYKHISACKPKPKAWCFIVGYLKTDNWGPVCHSERFTCERSRGSHMVLATKFPEELQVGAFCLPYTPYEVMKLVGKIADEGWKGSL